MTSPEPLVAFKGAFSYTGAAITDELLRRGRRVRTLSLGRQYLNDTRRHFTPAGSTRLVEQ